MNQILKYPLRGFAGVGVYNLPKDYLLLGIKVQDNNPVLYIEGDLNKPLVSLTMYCFHTGDEVEEDLLPIDTILLDNGKYVLHYYH